MNTPEQSTQKETPQDLNLPGLPVESTVRPARSPQRIVKRKAILSGEEDKTGQAAAAERSSITYTVQQQQGGPGANQRRNQNTFKLIAIVVMANNLLIAVAGVWFVYFAFGDIESRLQGPVAPKAPAVSPAVASTINTEEIEKHTAAVETRLIQQITDLKKELVETKQQTEASSKQQVEASTKQHEATEQKLDQVTRRVAAMGSQIQDHGPAQGTVAPASAASTLGNQSVVDLPPAQAELVLLKERNRLTSYADEAIATGSRDPYEQLWKALTDPRLASLVHAARAEILRVQECYLSGQRAKYYGVQQYQIPVVDIFPDAAALPQAQLSDDQLIQILEDKKLPWQAREKAAYYLGRHRSTKVGDALVKAVKEDPMLDVAAEATFSFEQVTGYRSKLFEADNLEAWWNSYKSAPPDNSGKPKEKPAEDKPAKADAKETKTPPTENKAAKKDEQNDKGSDKTEKEKPDKKEPKKKASIPLREPEDKP